MCAKISTVEEARLAKEHNNANALAFSGSIPKETALEMIETFIEAAPNEEEKYQRRINEIKEYDDAR